MPECCRCGADVSVGPSALWVNQKWKWVLDAVDQWQESLNTWVRQPQPIWDRARLEDRNLLRLLPKLLEKLGTAREARVFICIERGL